MSCHRVVGLNSILTLFKIHAKEAASEAQIRRFAQRRYVPANSMQTPIPSGVISKPIPALLKKSVNPPHQPPREAVINSFLIRTLFESKNPPAPSKHAPTKKLTEVPKRICSGHFYRVVPFSIAAVGVSDNHFV